ncbi:uncharacterized protein [Amphiura filiformis]|uniref:uncharacterized protein n=1 Tax=Amphiura filiformis TaxID=82378 RepID=UPI003B21B458
MQDANQYLEKYARRGRVDKFLSKTNIEKKFRDFADDLRDAAGALTNAVQTLMIPGVNPKQTPPPVAAMSDLTEIKDQCWRTQVLDSDSSPDSDWDSDSVV